MGLRGGQVGEVGLGAGAGGEAGAMRGRVRVQRIARGLGSTQRGRGQGRVGIVGRERTEGEWKGWGGGHTRIWEGGRGRHLVWGAGMGGVGVCWAWGMGV